MTSWGAVASEALVIFCGSMNKHTREAMVGKMASELEDMDLGDPRRDQRVISMGMALAADPSGSLPDVFRTEAELEGAYRALRNPSIEWRDILEPHVESTVERCRAAKAVLAVHDTSTLIFKGEGRAEALGVVENGATGFFLHASLAVSADNLRTPLGVLNLNPRVREEQPKLSKSKQVTRSRKKAQEDKESDRWRVSALEVEERFEGPGEQPKLIHVMDRESDSYPLMGELHAAGCRFVIRAKHDRVLQDGLKLWETVKAIEGKLLREVPISQRKHVNRAFSHPARAARMATLHFRAGKIVLPKPSAAQTEVRELPLYFVHVYEPEPPGNEPAVEWLLLTTEEVLSAEDAAQVVDWYRARWVIEEYFKALKTGCAYEKRQLESLHTLLNALALLAPIAWALLQLRSAARDTPNAPASTLFTGDQLKLLRALSVRVKLAARPTIGQAMLAIAGLGGHLKRNGSPGWQTLGKGYQEFLSAERTWAAIREANL